MSTDETEQCRYCETDLSGDDATYRVLYGRFDHAHDGVVIDKLVAGPNEELEPGTDERYYCLECYKEHHDREKGAHFEYNTAAELWSILEAADGRLVADAKPMTIGGRGWFRVVNGDLEARHSVMVQGGEDDDWDIGFETEPTRDFGKADFFDGAEKIQLVYLKPVDETPLVAGMNRTLDAVNNSEDGDE